MRSFLHYILFIWFFWNTTGNLYCQCSDSVLVNDLNVGSITLVYQLTFLNQNPVDEIDTIVSQILNDLSDSTNLPILIDKLASSKTNKAYQFLYTCCCRPFCITDINQFNTLTGTVGYYGGYYALNKYFLESKLSTELGTIEFMKKVILECRKNEPITYFCPLN